MKTADKFWYRWMLNYSFGELLGIGAAATIGRFLFIGFSNSNFSPGSSSFLTFIILLIAGAAEGFIIGYVQWKSLSKMILHFKPTPRILATTFFTIAGWLLVPPCCSVYISSIKNFIDQ